MGKIEGFIAAPLTAFHADGGVNLDIIPAYAKFLHANGVVGAFVNGTTGEGLSLTLDERLAIAEQWVQTAPTGFKVIVHVSHTCARSTGELSRHAARIGADGIGEMGPLFYRPSTVKDLVYHSALTAAQVPDLPYYYYHIPSMSGVCFPMIDFLRAAAPHIPNFTGIKYTHEDLVDYRQCCEFQEQQYDILYGRDETYLCALALGGRGAVGSTYNIMAPLYLQLRQAFADGALDEAARLQQVSMCIIDALIETTRFNAALKVVMKLLGLNLGGVRPPLQDLDEETCAQLQQRLEANGFQKYMSRGLNPDAT